MLKNKIIGKRIIIVDASVCGTVYTVQLDMLWYIHVLMPVFNV